MIHLPAIRYGSQLWAGVLLAAGCAVFVLFGRAAPPEDSSTQKLSIATEKVFSVTEAQAISAIVRAFTVQPRGTAQSPTNGVTGADSFLPGPYRGMRLTPAGSAMAKALVPSAHLTNGYILYKLGPSPVANLPLGKGGSYVPYLAYFHVFATALTTNRTRLTVRTVFSEVIEGKVVGIHGGTASDTHKVPPVPSEEEFVLDAVEAELAISELKN